MRRRRFHPRAYAEIVKRQGGICTCGCGQQLGTDPRAIEYDHIVALADGGQDTRAISRRSPKPATAPSRTARLPPGRRPAAWPAGRG